jgi:hypothetical protein
MRNGNKFCTPMVCYIWVVMSLEATRECVQGGGGFCLDSSLWLGLTLVVICEEAECIPYGMFPITKVYISKL